MQVATPKIRCSVTVPDCGEPGDIVNVAHDGRRYAVSVPDGKQPGETFNISIAATPIAAPHTALVDRQSALLVQVPEGAKQDDTVSVTHDGRRYAVSIPADRAPGETFNISIPDVAASTDEDLVASDNSWTVDQGLQQIERERAAHALLTQQFADLQKALVEVKLRASPQTEEEQSAEQKLDEERVEHLQEMKQLQEWQQAASVQADKQLCGVRDSQELEQKATSRAHASEIAELKANFEQKLEASNYKAAELKLTSQAVSTALRTNHCTSSVVNEDIRSNTSLLHPPLCCLCFPLPAHAATYAF